MSDATLTERITAYLIGGGLFNPELAIHDAVRDLLIDARSELAAARAEVERLKHLAWHVCESAEIDFSADESLVDRADLEKLAAALPEEHPQQRHQVQWDRAEKAEAELAALKREQPAESAAQQMVQMPDTETGVNSESTATVGNERPSPIGATEPPSAASADPAERLAEALTRFRQAFANRDETTSLHVWNSRMKDADIEAREALAKWERKSPTDVNCKVVTCQIYGHQIGLHYCENCNVTGEKDEPHAKKQ